MPFLSSLCGSAAGSQDGRIGTMIASSYGSCFDVASNAGGPFMSAPQYPNNREFCQYITQEMTRDVYSSLVNMSSNLRLLFLGGNGKVI